MGSCIPEAPYGIKALNEPFIVIPILPIIQGIEPHKVTKGEDFNQIPNRIIFTFQLFHKILAHGILRFFTDGIFYAGIFRKELFDNLIAILNRI